MLNLAGIFNRFGVRKKLPVFIVLLFVLILSGVFFLRSPVLVVTDASFYLIYGSQRFNRAAVRNSFALFRRIVPVPVAENAALDIIALVVETASSAPYAVIFPQRYANAAVFYSTRHPQTPVLVMWGRNPLPPGFAQNTNIVFVRTDMEADLSRAGAVAAVLAQETQEVLFLTDKAMDSAYLDSRGQYRQMFTSGLRAQGFTGEPVFLNANLQHTSYTDIGSVVIAGPASDFLERSLNIPVVLFSWIDPALTPHAVRIVFNDSPLALAPRALRAFSPDQREILVPSQARVLSNRIEERSDFRRLRSLLN